MVDLFTGCWQDLYLQAGSIQLDVLPGGHKGAVVQVDLKRCIHQMVVSSGRTGQSSLLIRHVAVKKPAIIFRTGCVSNSSSYSTSSSSSYSSAGLCLPLVKNIFWKKCVGWPSGQRCGLSNGWLGFDPSQSQNVFFWINQESQTFYF